VITRRSIVSIINIEAAEASISTFITEGCREGGGIPQLCALNAVHRKRAEIQINIIIMFPTL
jgi:hypothetical protein